MVEREAPSGPLFVCLSLFWHGPARAVWPTGIAVMAEKAGGVRDLERGGPTFRWPNFFQKTFRGSQPVVHP